MNYQSALEFLESFINYERRTNYRYNSREFNLDRMASLLEKLGNPHLTSRAIHIAGTKGKGSTASMIASILMDHGYSVGLYTSPHLVTPRERFRLNGEMISEEEFTLLVERIRPLAEEMRHDDRLGDLTFFELYTAIGFLWFSDRNTEIWVVEVGLGGRLDATNMLDPMLTIITPIGHDHTNILGHSLAEIAREKAGIVKKGVPLLVSPQEEEAMSAIRARCDDIGAPVTEVDKVASAEREATSPAGERFSAKVMSSQYHNLFLPLVGRHQISNALTAITAIQILEGEIKVSEAAVHSGLARVVWPGRIQVVRERPIVIIDVAHSPESIRMLRKTIQGIFKYSRAILILGLSAGKNIDEIAFELTGFADVMIVTKAQNTPRMMSPSDLRERLGSKFDGVIAIEKVTEALAEALTISKPDDLICVTGSFYHVGELMAHLQLSV
jgi:dihydrofolate synthase/folylpolyglutamate synthase